MKKIFILLVIFINITIFADSIGDIGFKFTSINKKYNINCYINNVNPSIHVSSWAEWDDIEQSDSAYLSNFMDIFVEELNKYPTDLIKNSKLKGVALVKNLKFAEEFVQSIPDAFGEIIYFDIQYGMIARESIKSNIHHSFFRMLEETVFGSLFYEDKEWTNLNIAEYIDRPPKGGEDRSYSYIEHPIPGFVNTFSMYGMHFDKAETFSFMMINEKYELLVQWIKTDSILNRKVEKITAMLRQFSPTIDSLYLEKIKKSEDKLPENYSYQKKDSQNNLKNETKTESNDIKSNFSKLYSIVKDPATISKLKALESEGIENKISTNGVRPQQLVDMAKQHLGIPYIYGRSDSKGTDCSGLTSQIFKKLGINMSRSTREQAKTGKVYVDKEDLLPGDMVFFTKTYNTTKLITHVGIYIGDKKFVNANSYYGKVMIDIIDDNYWKNFYIFGTRIFE